MIIVFIFYLLNIKEDPFLWNSPA